MLKQKFVFAVSLIAMVTVGIGAARADIASTVYVQQGVNSAKSAASAAQTSANNANTAAGAAQSSADAAQVAAEAAQASADDAAASAKTANDTVATKVSTAQGSTNASKAVITDSSGDITTGTIATGMIADSAVTTAKIAAGAVTSAKIADGTVALADMASNSVNSAKIVDGSIVNADISTNAAIAQSKISGLTDALSAKQATLTTSNIKGSGSVTVGIADGVITVTGTDNNTTYSTGTASTSGLTKLYTGTGSNTDGTMTQSAITTALSGKLSTSGTAAKATADASGNNIVNTYATKTQVADMQTTTNIHTSATTTLTGDALNTKYPSVGYVDTKVASVNTNLGTVTNTANQNAADIEGIQTTLDGLGALATEDTVTSSLITDSAVTTAKIAASAVTSAKIADGTVALADMASNSVNSAKIVDASIVNADISSSAAIAQSKISGLTTALDAKEATANKLTTDDSTTISDTNKDTLYPTIGRVMKEIDDTVTEVNNDISALNSGLTSLQTTVGNKQDKSTAVTHTASTAAGSASKPVYVTSAGAATAVTSIDASLLPAATSSALGGVKIGSNITNSNGTISVPAATSSALGVVKTGTNITNSSGTISVATANGSTLGVVKAGTNVSISSGSVSVATGTPSTLGLVKVGQIPSGSATSTTYATIWVE